MVDFINSLFQNGITLGDNISGQIVEVTLPGDGTEVKVPHRLKAVPKYRIILRQDNRAVIYDGEEPWNDKYVTLRANEPLGDITAVTFPGGTYPLNLQSATTYIPPTGCSISRSSNPGDVKVTMILIRG